MANESGLCIACGLGLQGWGLVSMGFGVEGLVWGVRFGGRNPYRAFKRTLVQSYQNFMQTLSLASETF